MSPRDVSKPARIALVTPEFDGAGGVPAVSMFILRAIARRPDLQVRVVSLPLSSRDPCSLLVLRPSTWVRGVTQRKGTARGQDFVHVGALAGEVEFMRLSRRRALAGLVADCDLIQVVAGTPGWASAVLGLGKPVALQVATLIKVERRMQALKDRGLVGLWRRLMTRIVSRMDEEALTQIDAVMVENPWMEGHARARIKTGAILSYAPPGVNTDIYRPADDAAPGDPPYILSVGRFSDPRKNVGLLLEAYGLAAARLAAPPDLVLAGADGPDDAFWARVRVLGLTNKVRFAKDLSDQDLPGLYRRAQSFALASDEEGFGMVVIEAMASGVPVVSTLSGGPDGIITDGHDGFLVPRDDAQAMAQRLVELAGDPARRNEMGANARATVETTYAEQLCGDRFLEIYDRLLAGA